jgi:uncharacterized small protein (DUF1192 family)
VETVSSLSESLRVLYDMRRRSEAHVLAEEAHLSEIDKSIAALTCEIARRKLSRPVRGRVQ